MERKPNIVFYFADQQRWDTLGCYGQPLPVSPNLDAIARNGVRYQNAFTCQPVCGPARACLQTGVYATQTGCFTNGRALPQNAKTIAHYLRRGGYETAYVGKWHLASEINGENYETRAVPPSHRGGYTDYWMASDVLELTSHGYNGYVHDSEGERVDFIGYRADCINNFAINYLHNKKNDKPFFMFVSQIEPHHQNDRERYEGPDGSKFKFKDFAPPGDLAEAQGDWRENYPDYLGQCHSLDYNIGRLVDTLKEKGLWENTILIYTSDHGSHFKTRNSEYKRSCHDACIHIPLIIHGPGFNGGLVEDGLVSLIDLPATILDCAGISVPRHFKGRSLGSVLKGESDYPDSVFLQISESHVGRAIRTKNWKYSVKANADPWKDSGADIYYGDCLYNLHEDPHELNNLIGESRYEKIKEKLAGKLLQSMEFAGENPPFICN